jgi:periplasmic copper chaperone A
MSVRQITTTLTALLLTGLMLAACSSPSEWSAGTRAASIHVEDAWARPEVAEHNSAAYLRIENTGDRDDRLIAATSSVAGAVEIHEIASGHDHVMRMQEVDAIVVPAGESVSLEPGGLHVMLLGLRQHLEPEDTFTLTLTFETAGEVDVSVVVRERT